MVSVAAAVPGVWSGLQADAIIPAGQGRPDQRYIEMANRLRKSAMEPFRQRGGSPAALDDLPLNPAVDDSRALGSIMTAVVEDLSPDGVAIVVISGETRSCEALSVLRFPTADAAAEALIGRTVLVHLN